MDDIQNRSTAVGMKDRLFSSCWRYTKRKAVLSDEERNIEARLKWFREKGKMSEITFSTYMSLMWKYLDARTEDMFRVSQIQPFRKQNLKPPVKHGGESVWFSRCFAAVTD